MLKQLPVNMLWVSDDLSRLARLSLTSFLRHGFRVTLWSYEPMAHAMSGADVRDAADLVPEGQNVISPIPISQACFATALSPIWAACGPTWMS